MMPLKSTLRATGASVTATIPKEIVDALGLRPGQSVHWMPDGHGPYRLLPVEPDQAAVLDSATVIMERYAPVFARLGREDH